MEPIKNKFGRNGPLVTRVGLGGEGVLRSRGRERDAAAVIQAALDLGLTYFDSAPAYAGCQKYLGTAWRAEPESRARIFQAGKSAQRRAAGAREDWENTLSVMGIDYLDLWQIHDLRTDEDFEEIAGPGGALEAFIEARDQGLVRGVGVTGHHDPDLLTRAVVEWPVDAVLLPINPVEAVLGGFLDRTIPAARQKGVAIIGMKVLGGGHYVQPAVGVMAENLIRFALAKQADVTIVGCSNPDEVRTLVNLGNETKIMTPDEQERITESFRPQARTLAYYRGRF